MRIPFLRRHEPRSDQEAERRVKEAQREKEISQHRLEEARPLLNDIRAMYHRNNVGSLLDKLVQQREEKRKE